MTAETKVRQTIFRAAALVKGKVVVTPTPGIIKPGDVAAYLTNLPVTVAADAGPQWHLDLIIGEGKSARTVTVDLAPFLCRIQYEYSKIDPIIILDSGQYNETIWDSDLRMQRSINEGEREQEVRLWALYKDQLYVVFVDPAYSRSENVEAARVDIKRM